MSTHATPSTSPPASPHRAQRLSVRAGDHEAFGRLFSDHADEVFSLAHRLTGSRALAEDVTSEAFLVAWRRRRSVELSDVPLRGWLLAIAARQSMNVTRGLRRRSTFVRSGRAEAGAVEDFADETAGRVDDARRLERTRAAMASLSRQELEVVSLCVWSELTYAEAADVLSVPVGTVRSRLHRARQRLRELTDDSTPAPARPTGAPLPLPCRTVTDRGPR